MLEIKLLFGFLLHFLQPLQASLLLQRNKIMIFKRTVKALKEFQKITQFYWSWNFVFDSTKTNFIYNPCFSYRMIPWICIHFVILPLLMFLPCFLLAAAHQISIVRVSMFHGFVSLCVVICAGTSAIFDQMALKYGNMMCKDFRTVLRLSNKMTAGKVVSKLLLFPFLQISFFLTLSRTLGLPS